MQKNSMQLITFLGLMLPCLLMSACASIKAVSPNEAHLTGAFIATRAEILVATNRKRDDPPSTSFSGERDVETHLVGVTVSVPPRANRRPGQLKWSTSSKANDEKVFHRVGMSELDKGDLEQWFLRHPQQQSGHVFLFVHGYNTRFDPGIFLLSQLVTDTGVKAMPVLFSWPSRGKLLAYNYDRESAIYARTALSEAIEDISAVPEVTQITILSHSMGGWLTMESLRTLALKHGTVPAKVRTVVLASPDIDIYVFGEQFTSLETSGIDFTILISKDDLALRAARWLGGNVDRMGRIDLKEAEYAELSRQSVVRVIDVSSIETDAVLNHRKFAESPEIVGVLGRNLLNGQPLSDNDAGLLERLGVLIVGGTKAAVETVDDARNQVKAAIDRSK
ncbi:alpha/beta hydrolase [Asticcacaulis sp. W401b]|uniref:alpha/beta hydrolase n=1 Tax=Asticcacaulis sp. W401b TaxID=3388666 RepID=UPI0039708D8D